MNEDCHRQQNKLNCSIDHKTRIMKVYFSFIFDCFNVVQQLLFQYLSKKKSREEKGDLGRWCNLNEDCHGQQNKLHSSIDHETFVMKVYFFFIFACFNVAKQFLFQYWSRVWSKETSSSHPRLPCLILTAPSVKQH